MAKQISAQEAAALVKDGMTIMVGGFLSVGGPNEVLHAIAESGVKDLTVIANDGGQPAWEHGLQELIHNGQVAHLWATHIGVNPEVGKMMNEGTMKVTLVPQGSMAEKIRAGGYGLGGVLTPTGLGTPVGEEAGKEVITVNGKEYLLEEPLHADIDFPCSVCFILNNIKFFTWNNGRMITQFNHGPNFPDCVFNIPAKFRLNAGV